MSQFFKISTSLTVFFLLSIAHLDSNKTIAILKIILNKKTDKRTAEYKKCLGYLKF